MDVSDAHDFMSDVQQTKGGECFKRDVAEQVHVDRQAGWNLEKGETHLAGSGVRRQREDKSHYGKGSDRERGDRQRAKRRRVL